ncbi:SMI1/KNR4 family protein [Streptomyces buecherae]|uniref:SMI1/KNR4 family protein n=1 Tax=Streptomyces buecherae TaxID=2763006 RepID=UPI0036673317
MTDERPEEDAVAQVTASWERIERWLCAHAPASADLLRPAASDAEIDAVEEAIGLAFPPSLRVWYRFHDGINVPEPGESWLPAGFLPGVQSWYPLDSVQDAYLVHTRDWEREPGRIPISCVTGDIWHGLYVDARADTSLCGTVGQWIVDHEPGPIPAGSVTGWPLGAWLAACAEAVEQGHCLVEPGGRRDETQWPVLTVCAGLTWVNPLDERHFPEGGTLLRGAR